MYLGENCLLSSQPPNNTSHMKNSLEATDDDGMVVYANTALNVQIPIRQGPLRFAVMGKNGLSSNSWRVWTESSGDAYIACRDSLREIKISLHQSGKQHVAFSSESGLEMTAGSRFWAQWTEPSFSNDSKVTPSFKLAFPNWALVLNYDHRQANPKKWRANQLLIEAADSDAVTVVSLFITDHGLNLTHDNSRSLPLGMLPARAGKDLWVITHQEPEADLKEVVERAIQKANQTVGPQLRAAHQGEVLSACLLGASPEGLRYMLVVPVKVH